MDADVSVIGLGRVGLPLALSFADRGLKVIGVDNDPDRLAALAAGRMPFTEDGAQEVLERVLEAGTVTTRAHAQDAAPARDLVLTLRTPSLSHIEIDMPDIRSVLDHPPPALEPRHR